MGLCGRILTGIAAICFGVGAQVRVGFMTEIPGASASAVARDAKGNVFVAGTTRPEARNTPLVRTDGVTPVPVALPADGLVTAMSIPAASPRTVRVGTTKGLWVTEDRGATWRTHFSTDPVVDVASAAGNAAVVYVSLGDGTKLRRSGNGGGTWANAISPKQDDGSAFPVRRVVVDSSNAARVVGLGSVAGPAAFLSEDGASTWKKLPGSLERVVFDPHRAGRLYGLDRFAGVVKSEDGGATWVPASGIAIRFQRDILVDPIKAGTVYVSGGMEGEGSGILKSEDGGASWRMAAKGPLFGGLAASGTGRLYAEAGSVVFASEDGFETVKAVTPFVSGGAVDFAAGEGAEVWVASPGSSDVFVSKLSAAGVIEWTTYLGGSQLESVAAIAVDGSGDVYVTGITESFDFPFTTTAPLKPSRAYAAKITGDGARVVYAAGLGQGAEPRAITVDANESAIVAGTANPEFEATDGAVQPVFIPQFWNSFSRVAMVVKLSPEETRKEFATFLGADYDAAGAVAVDGDGDLLVGGTELWKLSADGGRLVWSTWVEFWNVLALTPLGNGNVLVCGSSTNDSVWTTPDSVQPVGPLEYRGDPDYWRTWPMRHWNAYVMETAPRGQLQWSTMLGGNSHEGCLAVWPEANGEVVAAGFTGSPDFPEKNGLGAGTARGYGFATRVTARAREVVYSTRVENRTEFRVVGATRHIDGGAVLAGNAQAAPTMEEPAPKGVAVVMWVREP